MKHPLSESEILRDKAFQLRVGMMFISEESFLEIYRLAKEIRDGQIPEYKKLAGEIIKNLLGGILDDKAKV